MSIRRTPATISVLSATGAAVLAFGAWCGPAFASADVQAPSPEPTAHTETSLHEILRDDEKTSPAIRALESATRQADEDETEDLTILKSDAPRMTTRLPGVSTSNSPRFRRHMYRTDI